MIEPLYPLLDKQYVLFNEYLDSLMNDTLKVNINSDNMYYSYCYSENMEDIYTVHFYKDGFTGIQIIVYWNGERMSYQSVSPGLNVDYKPKKSVKDECLAQVEQIRINTYLSRQLPEGDSVSHQRIMESLSKLESMIKSMEDNT